MFIGIGQSYSRRNLKHKNIRSLFLRAVLKNISSPSLASTVYAIGNLDGIMHKQVFEVLFIERLKSAAIGSMTGDEFTLADDIPDAIQRYMGMNGKSMTSPAID